jgi:hypothetical protein
MLVSTSKSADQVIFSPQCYSYYSTPNNSFSQDTRTLPLFELRFFVNYQKQPHYE